MWDCASQLWVLGRSRVHGRPYLSLCPVTLQHFSSDVDEYADGCLFEKGAALYPFRPGGGTGRGGLGRGGEVRGVQSKNRTCLPSKNNSVPPVYIHYYYVDARCICPF